MTDARPFRKTAPLLLVATLALAVAAPAVAAPLTRQAAVRAAPMAFGLTAAWQNLEAFLARTFGREGASLDPHGGRAAEPIATPSATADDGGTAGDEGASLDPHG